VIFGPDSPWSVDVSGSLFTVDFQDGSVHVGQAPTCIVHGDSCACVAKDVMFLHGRMPVDNDFREKLKSGVPYTLTIKVPPFGTSPLLHRAQREMVEQLSSAGTQVVGNAEAKGRHPVCIPCGQRGHTRRWCRQLVVPKTPKPPTVAKPKRKYERKKSKQTLIAQAITSSLPGTVWTVEGLMELIQCTDSLVTSVLRSLFAKGFTTRKKVGQRYVYTVKGTGQ